MASQPSPDQSTFFSMRIVSIDYYISPPVPDLDFSFSPFLGQKVDKVPVIRIYGSALSGQKTCMHLHRALPYLYVPCSDANAHSLDECRTYSRLICHSLDNALKLRNSLESKKQHVHGFSLVRARSFYGYHRTDELFVKIYLYYPHEVSRAASLFLEGAVLNKAIQPYESHIPYLLQFLVDHNLYGMGLLHLSKLKFRLPILDHFVSKESCYGKQSIPVMADSNGQLPQVRSVWDSSSIPSAWLWPSRGPTRQSTSALEGDAIVDDVLNQQFKMYTSLSQTKSEVKMVQSLVPIWEEEYLRTGNIEHVKSPDKGKPPPDYVLKEFCLGLEREKACLALYEEAQSQQSFQGSPLAGAKEFVQSIKSMSEETSLFDKELGECDNSDGSFSAILHEESKEGMSSEQVQGGSKGDDQPCESLPKYSYTPLFQSSNLLEKKVADDDTLGLLRWLASSQAMDDLCTDDDLVNEVILSPLLPKSMETVLEKAYLDYEIESQQECEDILDSVGTRHRDLDSSTSEQVIPQTDGSPDEQFLTHRMDELSKSQKKKVWGSLPLSNSQVMLNDFSCSNETKDNSKCKYLDKIRDGVCEDPLNEENVSFTSSLRELMRRKRVQQAGSSDDEIHGTKKLACMKQKGLRPDLGHHEIHDNKRYGKLPFFTHSGANDEESFTDFGNLEIPCEEPIVKYHSSNPGRQAFASSFHEDPNECFSSRSKELAFRTVVGNVGNGDGNLPAGVSVKDYDEVDNHYINKAATSIFESGQNVDPGLRKSWTLGSCINDGEGKQHCLHKDGLQLDVYDVVDNVKSTELTLNIRPPPLDVGSRNMDHTNFFKMDNLNGSFYERQPAENSLLFLDESGVEQREYKYEGSEETGRVRNENLLGVPTHCLNDGSLLYLLTPASVPPSETSVSRWLMQQKSHKLPSVSSVMKEVRTIPLSPKYNKTEIEQPTSDDGMFSCSADGHLSWKLVSSKPVQTDGFDKIVASPSKNIIDDQDKDNKRKFTANLLVMSQISGPESKSKITPVSQIGFRDPAAVGASQQLTMLSIEVVANSRGDLRPDPRHDAINIITLVIQEDSGHLHEVIVLTRDSGERNYDRLIDGMSGCKVKSFSEEKCLIDEFMRIIHYFDPDILVGWEIQGGSLGFLAERAVLLGVRLLKTISRIPPAEANVSCSKSGKSEAIVGESSLEVTSWTDSVMLEDTIIEDEWGRTHASGLHVGGRIVLNLWRILSSEVKLNMYTLEAASEVVLRRKVPFIPSSTLMAWYSSGDAGAICSCIKYAVERAKLNFEIIIHLDLIGRTAELARVYGIDFFSVLSRGSQYRVESMYLRLAHTQNYLSISPGNQQVASQPAMECLPLVMEPESGYYIDPVVVLDFQSLYPSMIIGYNLCYCTCLGKVMPSTINKLGVSSYSPDMQILADLKGEILLTPNGVMYVPQKIRKGVLPCMLEEILSTRVMVKQAMKNLSPSQQVLSRIFNARQLALKLIANVTYGYTAAGFSGRMPCAELADSIVQCGRKTLETAISFVNSHRTWNARVIYGDTDSMFVLLKGRTLREAFKIGQEIASEITAINPIPVTLKMEKVYYPCVLLTKKRYVGYSYEKADQVEPIFDAKGIETVRRDSCSAVAKTLEQSLRILFESCNVSLVREYLVRQWTRIFCGKVTLQDFVFSKEVRLGTYRTHSLPPAALVATKAMKIDPRAEPRYAERIPYVVVHGEPGARLIDMVVDPLELLDINSPYRLNDIYYISKQIIPALQRVFGLLGADLHKWFSEMRRPVKRAVAKRNFNVGDATFVQEFDDDKNWIARKPIGSRTRIDSYYLSQDCFLCGKLVQSSSYLCQSCSTNKPVLATALVSKTSKLERDMQHLAAICLHCGGGGGLSDGRIKCKSLACSVFYERSKVQKELQTVSTVATDVGLYPRCNVEWF